MRRAANRDIRIREIEFPPDRALGRAHGLLKRTFPRAELVALPEWRETLRERAAGFMDGPRLAPAHRRKWWEGGWRGDRILRG